MFNPKARISSKAAHDRLLRDRAVEEAAALFQRHGAEAMYMVSNGLIDSDKDAEERRHDRLVILEIERLERLARKGPAATAVLLWQPPLFSLARLRGFLRRAGGGSRPHRHRGLR